MNKPTQEQIKEFWEYFDIAPLMCNRLPNVGKLIYPEVDLNNIFKYAVPRLFQNGLFISLVADKRFCRATILSGILDRKDKVTAVGEHKDPALALFWAIYKVIIGIPITDILSN